MRRLRRHLIPATRALALVLALVLVSYQALEASHLHPTSELSSECLLCHGHAPLAAVSFQLLLPLAGLALLLPARAPVFVVRLSRTPQQARAPPVHS